MKVINKNECKSQACEQEFAEEFAEMLGARLEHVNPTKQDKEHIHNESKGMVKVVAIARPARASDKPKVAPGSYKVQKLVTFFRCLRCGKEWIPRFQDKEPTVCKFCKNPYWNKPRQKK